MPDIKYNANSTIILNGRDLGRAIDEGDIKLKGMRREQIRPFSLYRVGGNHKLYVHDGYSKIPLADWEGIFAVKVWEEQVIPAELERLEEYREHENETIAS